MSLLPINSHQLTQLFMRGKRMEFTKGEFIVRPSEGPSGVYYIESGLVKSYNYTRYGEENLLSLRKTGELIGLTFAITGKRLEVNYAALMLSTLWWLPTERFLSALHSEPESSMAIIGALTEMYRLHSEHILNLEYRSVRERLIAFLLILSQRLGKKINGTMIIEAPLRHQDIASFINASRETTSREMNHLQSRNLIEFSQGIIVLKDLTKLNAFLEIPGNKASGRPEP